MLRALVKALVSLISSSGGVFGEQLDYGRVEPEAVEIPLVELLANGQAHDGAIVRVTGVLQIELEGDQLCQSKEALRYSITRDCLALGLEAAKLGTTRDELARANGEYVVVEGTFRAPDHGHLSLFAGAVRQVTRILLWERAQGVGELGRCGDPDFFSAECWDVLIERGEQLLSQGKYREALEAFLAADRLDIFEVPNYEALHRIAEVRCLLGDRKEGLKLLEDFRCMIAVDRGEIPCFVGRETSADSGTPNPVVSELCYLRMCGEIYLPYYENLTQEQLAGIAELEREADRAQRTCEAGESRGS